MRTYVDVGGKPGIFFFSLDTHSRLAVAAARRTYRLPYFHARQRLVADEGTFEFRSHRISEDGPDAGLACRYAPKGPEFTSEPGSLEHWLVERYCLYTLAEGMGIQRGEIHHPPWQLQAASADFDSNTMASDFPFDLHGEPVLQYSARQDVLLWQIERVTPS